MARKIGGLGRRPATMWDAGGIMLRALASQQSALVTTNVARTARDYLDLEIQQQQQQQQAQDQAQAQGQGQGQGQEPELEQEEDPEDGRDVGPNQLDVGF